MCAMLAGIGPSDRPRIGLNAPAERVYGKSGGLDALAAFHPARRSIPAVQTAIPDGREEQPAGEPVFQIVGQTAGATLSPLGDKVNSGRRPRL